MLSIYASEGNQLVLDNSPWSAFTRGGAHITAAVPGCNDTLGDGQSDIGCLDDSGFAAAEAAAKAADVVLLFAGLRPAAFTPKNASSDAWEGEGRDRIRTDLPGLQPELIQRVAAANKNVVLILIHGAPLSIEDQVPQVVAILDASYPGELGGPAIFNTIFGKSAPAGRLTTTWYDKSFIGTRPIGDMSLRGNGGITYMHYEKAPVFSFGFGIGYTTFRFTILDESPLVCETSSLSQQIDHYSAESSVEGGSHSPCVYRVQVDNTGAVTSDVVVLGFLNSSHVDAPRNKELFGFERLSQLAPGESRTVALPMPAQVLSLVDVLGNEYVRAGSYRVEFGVEGSAEGTPARGLLEMVGEDILVSGQHLLKTDDTAAATGAGVTAAVTVFASQEQLPLLTKKLQHYNSGLVTMARVQRDAHLLPLAGASYLRVDVGLGWGASSEHMSGIFGNVIRNYLLASFDPSPILQLSRLLNSSGVTPIYSWCYNPFASDFTKPQTTANLTVWKALHRQIAHALRSEGLHAIHELYNEPDLSWSYTGTWTEYLQQAVAAAQGLKEGNPSSVIIGPAAAIPSAERLRSLLALVSSGELPLDALSIHAYGAGVWQDHARIAKDALAVAGLDHLPIHINELNPVSTADPNASLRLDSFALASMVLDTIAKLLSYPQVTMANWAQFLESGAGDKWGVVTEAGLLKPAFHAFNFYAKMPESRKQMVVTLSDNSNSTMNGFASASSSIVAAAFFTTGDASIDCSFSVQGATFHGPATLHVYMIDATHNNQPTAEPLRPSLTKALPASETGSWPAAWVGVLAPHATLFFELVPASVPQSIVKTDDTEITSNSFVPTAQLPDVMTFANGTKVTSTAMWRARREELKTLLDAHILGTRPAVRPKLASYNVTTKTGGAGGSLVSEQISLRFNSEFGSIDGEVKIELLYTEQQAAAAPRPALLTQFDHRDWAQRGASRDFVGVIMPTGDTHDDTWPLFYHYNQTVPRPTWGLIARRAWLVSLIIDFITAKRTELIDPGRLHMFGHSRNGKQTLIAAAYDERILSVAGSSPGFPIATPARFASNAYAAEQWPSSHIGAGSCSRSGTGPPDENPPDLVGCAWWTASVQGYYGRAPWLPADGHFVTALIAPRNLVIGSAHNDHDSDNSFSNEQNLASLTSLHAMLDCAGSAQIAYRPGDHVGLIDVG